MVKHDHYWTFQCIEVEFSKISLYIQYYVNQMDAGLDNYNKYKVYL
jgi:hypothetical protein